MGFLLDFLWEFVIFVPSDTVMANALRGNKIKCLKLELDFNIQWCS